MNYKEVSMERKEDHKGMGFAQHCVSHRTMSSFVERSRDTSHCKESWGALGSSWSLVSERVCGTIKIIYEPKKN